MSMRDETVEIPSIPQPTSILWLGVTAAGGALGWLVTVVTIFAGAQTPGQLIAAGLCASVTLSIAAVMAWARYSLAKTACEHHRQMSDLFTGQMVLMMAEARSMRRAVEQASGLACAERQALSTKLTKVIEDMPTYWNGVADEIQYGVENNVREIGRPRGPNR